MSFLEFYNNKLILDFNLDNINSVAKILTTLFIMGIIVLLTNFWIKEKDSSGKTDLKIISIGVISFFTTYFLFFSDYNIKNIYTSVFYSQDKTNYINYLNNDIEKTKDFKKIYSYVKYLKENNDQKNMDWSFFNEISLINSKYYFNDYNNYNNNKENTKNKYFIDENYKVFPKEFGRNYKYFFNMFAFTEMMFIDKTLKEKVNNKIQEIEKDNLVTNQEFFYLLNNIKEYISDFDYYSNKYYTQKSNRRDKEIPNFENILSDKEKQNKFLNYLLKWSNNEMIIKDEQSFNERNVLRNLNNDYYIKYFYVGSKNSNKVSYNFSFDTDELFTTLDKIKYKKTINMSINGIYKDNIVTNKEFVNLINNIYIYIIQERTLENRIYNSTESVYYDYYDNQ